MQIEPLKSKYGHVGENLAEALEQLSLDLVALVASYILPHWPRLGDRFNIRVSYKQVEVHATVVGLQCEPWLFRLRYTGEYGIGVSAWFRLDELLPYDTTPSDCTPQLIDDDEYLSAEAADKSDSILVYYN